MKEHIRERDSRRDGEDEKISEGINRFLKDKHRAAPKRLSLRASSEKKSFNPNFDERNRFVGNRKPDNTPSKHGAEKSKRGAKPDSEKPKRNYTAKREGFGKAKRDAGRLKSSGLVRLNRFIASSGICSRREADE